MASIISNTQLAGAVVVSLLLYEPEDAIELDWVRTLLAPATDEPIQHVVVHANAYLRKEQIKSVDGYFVYTIQQLNELAVEVLDKLLERRADNEEELRLVKFLIDPDDESKIPEAINQAMRIIRTSYHDNLEGED